MASNHKTIQLSLNIGANDLKRKLKQGVGFLTDGKMLTLEWSLKGRQKTQMHLLKDKVDGIIKSLIDENPAIRVSSMNSSDSKIHAVLVLKGAK